MGCWCGSCHPQIFYFAWLTLHNQTNDQLWGLKLLKQVELGGDYQSVTAVQANTHLPAQDSFLNHDMTIGKLKYKEAHSEMYGIWLRYSLEIGRAAAFLNSSLKVKVKGKPASYWPACSCQHVLHKMRSLSFHCALSSIPLSQIINVTFVMNADGTAAGEARPKVGKWATRMGTVERAISVYQYVCMNKRACVREWNLRER